MRFIVLMLGVTMNSYLYSSDDLPPLVFPAENYIHIDLTNQKAWLKGGLIAGKKEKDRVTLWESEISSGREDKPSPKGLFKISHKHEKWVSTIYNVKMPYFLRLNSSEIGIHAGPLPGYPGSAGCIRLPEEIAAQLFTLVDIGTPVVIEGVAPTIEELREKWRQSRSNPFTKRKKVRLNHL